jgi:hypothetical protein
MRAELLSADVFYLEGQSGLCEVIAKYLRSSFGGEINISHHEIDPQCALENAKEQAKLAAKYVKFLKTSAFSTTDFDIVVRRDDDTAWYYFGSSGETGQGEGTYLALPQAGLSALFPAVAMLGRMVLLPEVIRSGLDKHPRTFDWCPRPLEACGVLLVDFTDEGAVEGAIVSVASRLKRELKRICHFHTMTHPFGIKQPDFHALGTLLHVHVPFLKALDLEMPVEQLPKLTLKTRSVVLKEPSELVFELANVSSKTLQHVRVRLKAPGRSLDGALSEFRDLAPEDVALLTFRVIPAATPYLPLEATVDTDDGDMVWKCTFPFILDVQRA